MLTLDPRTASVLIGTLVLSACSMGQSLRMGTGYISHNLCTAAFVSEVDVERTFEEAVRPMRFVRWLGWAIRYDVDESRQEVRTRVFGGFEQGSAHVRGGACQAQFAGVPPSPPLREPATATSPLLPPIAGSAVVGARSPRLRAAVDAFFAPSPENANIFTKALVVVQAGRVVAEQYAPGYGPRTKLPGFSDTKSVVSALIAILVRQGRLRLDQPAPIAEWATPADPRRAITVDHLVRMQSGLDFEESVAGAADDAPRQWFLSSDMAGLSIGRGLTHPPGTHWSYSSGDTLLLSRILRDAVGGTREAVARFAQQELFGPLGMGRVELEYDRTGTPMGAAGMSATARDWARFGVLYAQDGIAGAARILPEGWVAYSATPAPPEVDAWIGYGAGFWTNRGDSFGAARRRQWGAPPGSFFASGHLGQIILIVPEDQLVIGRFGWAHGPSGGFSTLFPQLGEVVAAVRSL